MGTERETPGITDEAIARLRARIGVPEPHPQPPHYRRPDVDAFRHVANAYGDDNPLLHRSRLRRRHPVGGPDRPAAAGRRRHPRSARTRSPRCRPTSAT